MTEPEHEQDPTPAPAPESPADRQAAGDRAPSSAADGVIGEAAAGPAPASSSAAEPPLAANADMDAAPAAMPAPASAARGAAGAPAAAAEASRARPAAARTFVAAYEHFAVVRFCHWLNAITLTVMVTSGWRIFIAFPSFGPRVPERSFLNIPESLTLGGWLGGALQWHYTFAWVFVATGLVYVAYLVASGQYHTMLFRPRDLPGVWPMVRHYFFFGPQPPQTEAYNPLQKLAYTSIVLCGALSVLTGLVILRPVQFSPLTWLMGGFHLARVWHFIAMCGFVAFIPGHLVMVALHGWNNFMSMVSGWKKNPEYLDR